MKKVTRIILSCLCALILSSTLVHAEVTTSVTSTEKESMRTTVFKKVVGTSTQTLPEKKKDTERLERITAQAEKMKQRLDSAITRLESITNRLDSRITKIEATGITLESAKQKVAQARTETITAKATSNTLPALFAEIKSSDVPLRVAFEKMKRVLKDTEARIKIAHKAVVEAIVSVKASAETTATSTPTNRN